MEGLAYKGGRRVWPLFTACASAYTSCAAYTACAAAASSAGDRSGGGAGEAKGRHGGQGCDGDGQKPISFTAPLSHLAQEEEEGV